jgi:hypothetical protein
LARSSDALDFETPRLTRLYGSTSALGAHFRVLAGVARLPRLVATDFDAEGCPPVSIGAPITTGGEASVPAPSPVEGGETGGGEYYGEPQPVYQSDGSCNVTLFADSCSGDSSTDSSADDSCSGDTSRTDSSSDSCSGDASDDSSDSCSGDSSSGDTSSDSCSGDADSGNDDSGCGKSEYDGDTCSGSSSSSGADRAERSSSAALNVQKREPRHRPRPVRLSLLTLLAAALALPLRRRAASR